MNCSIDSTYMHRVKIDTLALLIVGAILNLGCCSLRCRSHPHVYCVQCFILNFTMLYTLTIVLFS
jgi:hypothetical protein